MSDIRKIRKVGAYMPVSVEALKSAGISAGAVTMSDTLLEVMNEDVQYPTATPERRAEIDANRRRRAEVAAQAAAERDAERRAAVEDRIAELRVEHDRDPEAFFRRVAEAEQEWDDHIC